MSTLSWIASRRRLFLTSLTRRRNGNKPRRKGPGPSVEALESIDLLTRAVLHPLHLPAPHIKAQPAAHVLSVQQSLLVQRQSALLAAGAQAIASSLTNAATIIPVQTSQTVSTTVQNATVPQQLTNFSGVAFAPSINLFDPTLGTLESVTVTETGSINSQITSENTSLSSGATITGTTTGQFSFDGIDPTGATQTVTPPPASTDPVTVGAYTGPEPPDFTGPTTVVFPTLTVPTPPSTSTFTYTSASDLAFFTASAGRSSIAPSFSASASSTATAPNGNLQTMVTTQAGASISVTYQYAPFTPTVVSLVRFGIHHQPTTLLLTLSGPGDAATLSNTANYTVLKPNANGSFTGPGVKVDPVISAVYNSTNNTVLLTLQNQINFHTQAQLLVNYPFNNGQTIVIQFGGIKDLGGFLNPHKGNVFVPVISGHVVRS